MTKLQRLDGPDGARFTEGGNLVAVAFNARIADLLEVAPAMLEELLALHKKYGEASTLAVIEQATSFKLPARGKPS